MSHYPSGVLYNSMFDTLECGGLMTQLVGMGMVSNLAACLSLLSNTILEHK